MQIKVKVHPRARKSEVRLVGDTYLVATTAPAVDGKANEAAIKLLADYLEVKKSQIMLMRGNKSREKIFAVDADVKHDKQAKRHPTEPVQT